MTKTNEERFSSEIGTKESRKLQAIREKKRSVWIGFGTFGMIGWSIAVPTVLGTALGIWLDKNYSESFSWTLTFLVAGLFVGCAIAWQWVAKENKAMHQDNRDKDE
jgi:ATP synthase protein I